MKKIVMTCSTLMMLQFSVAQNIDYNGYKYETSGFNENDSTVTFFPIDNNKLTSLNPNNNDWVEYSVPNHPGKKGRFYIGNKIIEQKLSAYITVIDTINKKENTEEKRKYIEFRLSVLNTIREHIAEIKAQEGKKLKEENEVQRNVYWKIMQKFGGENGEKEKIKCKIGKYSMAAIQQFEDEMTVEENSLKQVLAIPDTVEFLKAFVNGNGVIGRESESMARNNLNIKIPDCFIGYARGNTSKYKEASNRFENSVLETRERNKEIFFKNPILSDSAISIRNPKYKGIGYAEWWWLQNMRGYEYDDGLKHVQTSYPVETNYYKSEKYPEYQFYPLEFPIPGKGWYVTDNKKNLLGVQYKGFEADSLEKALMLYDFEHNAYNIKSESRGTQEWVLYNLKKRGNHKADALDWAHLGIMVGAGTVLDESQRLRYLYASGRISKTEYDRQIAELKKTAKAVNRAANRLANSMPSAEEQERAEKYIKQLESDYYHKYDRETVNAERLNGTQMMLYTTDTKVKALLTYYLNDNGKLTIAIDIIEKK